MGNRFGLLSVKNAELLAGLSRLVQRGNELTAEVLAHLAELEERRLHLQLGFPSLFAYCVEALGLSEGSAGRRVAAARVCRRFPEAFELVARGDLHLSALCGLAPHLNPQNATELFTACCRKTRRQVDELLAARFPKPDVREQIRRLPTRAPVQVPVIADEPEIETHDDAAVEPNAASQGPEITHTELPRFFGNNGSEPAPPILSSPPDRRRELEALSADRFGVHFTADAELKELLERARALASHRLPNNDLSSLMRLVLSSFVKHEEARRFAVGRKPRRARAAAPHAKAPSPSGTPPGGVGSAIASAEDNSELVRPRGSQVAWVAAGFAKQSKRSRHVPAAVRREVYLRDRGQCSFVSEDGRRCEARAALELDHVEPWAKLGDAQVDNIRLRCRAHNQLHARECFGVSFVEGKIAARLEAASSSVASLVSNPAGSTNPSSAASL
jgi:hypothetical protein